MPALPKSSDAGRLDKPADADADDPPAPGPSRVIVGTKRPAASRCEARPRPPEGPPPGLADREQSEDHGPMRDRLVAGDANAVPGGRVPACWKPVMPESDRATFLFPIRRPQGGS